LSRTLLKFAPDSGIGKPGHGGGNRKNIGKKNTSYRVIGWSRSTWEEAGDKNSVDNYIPAICLFYFIDMEGV